LLRGPSGAGKSDLALRFLFLARRGPAAPEPPILVADDQVRLEQRAGRLMASAPAAIRGKIEVRGVGIVEVKSLEEAELALVVDLVPASEVERMPDGEASATLMGTVLPLIRLCPWEPSAPIKLAVALARAKHTDSRY
jgi:serine kinase of HPr protein (carbohydrate metabolism regulator)